MAKYVVIAKVDQIVTKEIRLEVVANSEEEATTKTRAALQTYPKEIEEDGINRIVTMKSNYWIPRDIDIASIKEMNDKNN